MPVKLLITTAISALLLVPGSALAQQDSRASRGDRGSEETGDGTRMICRIAGVTGSRVKAGRICMTAEEWAETKRNNRALVEQNQQRRPSQDQ